MKNTTKEKNSSPVFDVFVRMVATMPPGESDISKGGNENFSQASNAVLMEEPLRETLQVCVCAHTDVLIL